MELERMAAGQTIFWEVISNTLKAYHSSSKLIRVNSLGISGWGTLRNVVNALSMKTLPIIVVYAN